MDARIGTAHQIDAPFHTKGQPCAKSSESEDRPWRPSWPRAIRRCIACSQQIELETVTQFCPLCAFSGALEEERAARRASPRGGPQESESPPSLVGIPSDGIRRRGILSRPPTLGGYELLEEIGRGGMGVVYRARQRRLNRIVALKCMLPFGHPESAARFRTEAKLAASLPHPNIVAVHEAGEHDGQLYYSMDYVKGPSLAKILREGPLTPPRARRYVGTLARAVQYVHEQGVVHRDLKPSNVLIDAFDQPQLTDFGLAQRYLTPSSQAPSFGPNRHSDGNSGEFPKSDLSLTLWGEVLGSPSFMAPEQAAGQQVGPASDIFSLGALLYHALVGRPPFQGDTLAETLHQVLHADPIAPRELDSRISPDLDALCRKCLQKDPGQRFLSAQEMANALSQGRPEEFCSTSPTSGSGDSGSPSS